MLVLSTKVLIQNRFQFLANGDVMSDLIQYRSRAISLILASELMRDPQALPDFL